MVAAEVFTIGHSTRTLEELIALLRAAGITCLLDVRSIPRSRAFPQFNAEALAESLAAVGIDYLHLPALGGRRHRRRDAPPSPNRMWRNASFRAYADYAATEDFRAGLEELKARAARKAAAIMCAEALWWRCHRRIIADYLLAEGIQVEHILGAGRVERATLTPGVRRSPDGTLVYA
jgi:uncharacterized protein (DUF488 family)